MINIESMMNHPVKNSLNFCHPSKGGECVRLQLGDLLR